MTPLGSNVFEVITPRIEEVLTIDQTVQIKLNREINARNHRTVMSLFDEGLKNGSIKLKTGITIKHLY